MMTPVPFIFEQLMTFVQAEYDVPDGEKPYFLYGSRKEMNNKLTAYAASPTTLKQKRFPLVGLFLELDEVHSLSGEVRVQDALMLIAAKSEPEWFVDKRYEERFVPELYPIYEVLVKYLRGSGLVIVEGDIRKIDQPYNGSDGDDQGFSLANILGEFTDGILLNFDFIVPSHC